jgi:NAD(P)-dependent dehydrogenase (short-subunit alcohol dehydrogenase family)
MGQIDGYKVVVTASNGAALAGLGGAALRRIAREGARVTLVAPDAAAAEPLVASVDERARFIESPLQEFGSAVRSAAQQMGGLDALVNVVQPDTPWQPFEQKGAAGFQPALDGLAGAVAAMQAAWPYLKKRGDGARVVNVGSVYGASSYAHVSDSVASDYALQGITRAAGVEWAPNGVRVNFLGPGALDVPEYRRWRERSPAAIDHRVGSLAMRRLGNPDEDFGGALMLVLSDEGCFLVGQTVYADGGQHLVAPVLEPGVQLT